MIHWHPIKELVHQLTGLSVESSAVIELTNYFEEEIKKVVLQIKEELQKLNGLKEIQGLYQKNRIDRDCIKNAIKTLNTKNDSHPTQECVRSVKEKEVNIEVT
jgi:DNA repair ATPase RecN